MPHWQAVVEKCKREIRCIWGFLIPASQWGGFLCANGYKGNGTNVSTTAPVYYSDVHLNPESTPEKKKHSILVYDHTSQRLVVGFEDLPA
jgi:hypothetical protein